MFSSATFSTLFLLSVASGSTLRHHTSRDSGIKWGPCKLNTTLPVQCAKLPVPLDYTDKSSNQTLDLDLIRYPAQNGPSKGSILLNFGGPGQDGLNSMLSYAPIQAPITGGHHDLISWDPRGTGNTLRFACWPEELDTFHTTLGTTLYSSADTAGGRLWAETKLIADICYASLNKTGDLVGMAFVARDMMQIVDALGEDGMLRYWGISGGTGLGSTVAAMFPDRMDKIILDGVMNVHQYYNGYETEAAASTDATFDGFLAGCAASPDVCPLAHGNRTSAELKTIMLDFFDTIRESPIPISELEFVLDYTILKSTLFSTLYRPRSWPLLGAALDSFMEGDPVPYLENIVSVSSTIPREGQAVLGIRCGDKAPRTSSYSVLEPVISKYFETSAIFGDATLGLNNFACAQWNFEAKERYEGDFNVKTKNPILFIGNSFDPVTPLISAQNMSASFDGSVLLRHNGYGHLSFSQPSNCTNKYIADYFLTGALPKDGTVCEPNEKIFRMTQ